jgi:hypothetical protein
MPATDLIGRSVVIRRRVPSQNQFAYRQAAWRAFMRERDAWLVLLRAQLPPRQPPDHPVRIRLVSYRSRLIDFANLVGGAKPIPDCLQRLGYIRDDDPRWFECEYVQYKVPKIEERTEISFLPWSAGEIPE